MKARTFIVTSLVLLAAAPLYAQDPPKEAGKAETPPAVGTAPTKPPAEKAERVMDPKAMKLIDAYRAAIHTPASAGLKSFSAKGELAAGMGPDPITLSPTWNAKDGLTVAIGIPDSLAEMIPQGRDNIYDVVDQYSRLNRLGYVHLRNVRDKVPHYKETFIDDGEVDVLRVLGILKRNGFEGVIIPDHAPQMSCAAPWHAGMAYAMGYIKAGLQSLENK